VGHMDHDLDWRTACQACPEGTFQNTPGQTACKDATNVCKRGTKEVQAPTKDTPRICEPCDGITEYQDLADEAECKPVTDCQPGSFQVAESTPTRNRGCLPCNGVAEYQDKPGQFGCKPIAPTCSFGHAEAAAPTASSDRVCVPCQVTR